MSQYPRIRIKNFAGIREADVDLAPLTLFVGDNNSGKTYLSSLIWGLDELPLWRFPLDNDLSPPLQMLLDGIDEVIVQTECERYFSVSQAMHDAILIFLNTYLKNENVKSRWIAEIFGKDISTGEVFLSIPYREDTRFVLIKKKYDNGERFVVRYEIKQQGKIDSTVSHSARVLGSRLSGSLKSPTVFMALVREYWRSYWGRYHLRQKSFFPEARSGLLLANSAIVKDLKGSLRLRRLVRNYQFTAPQTQFSIGLDEAIQSAKTFFSPSQDAFRKTGAYYDKRVTDIVSFIETSMIRGKVIASDATLPELLYQPDNAATSFAMNVSSGVVTSIAPILASLKYGNIGNRCFIEEPEMSLHPELERRMSQVLVRLANSIEFVLASTHSDIITQHVNNMIKLSKRSDAEQLLKEYGYVHKDVISLDNVRMYQFEKAADGLTDVKLLDSGVNGFRLPMFGKTLCDLRDETWTLQIENKEELKNV